MEEMNNNYADNQEGMLSVDDLILEIGKLHVEKLGAEKKVTLLTSRLTEFEALQKEGAAAKVKVDALSLTNATYLENNKKLDRALVEERTELTALKALLKNLEIEHAILQNKYELCGQPIEAKQAPEAKIGKPKSKR